MWQKIRGVVTDAVRDLSDSWRSLAITDLVYKGVGFALLTPATVLLVRWMASRTGTRVVADADLVRFFVTTRVGVLILIVGGGILLAITALEMACLMAIGLAGAKGTRLNARSALAFGAKKAPFVLALMWHMLVRVILGVLPFLAALGLVYFALLRPHDINYYLAHRPPMFYVAAAIGGVILAALAALLVRTIARWALALPLVLFENVLPRRALGESARRSSRESLGDRDGARIVGGTRCDPAQRGQVASRGPRRQPGTAARRLAGGAAAVCRGPGFPVGRGRPDRGHRQRLAVSPWPSFASTCTSASRGSHVCPSR